MADSSLRTLIPGSNRGRPKKKQPDIEATPETIAKLKPDELTRLLALDLITPEQERAGRRLHHFMLALQSGGSPVSRLHLPVNVRRRGKSASPLDRLNTVNQQVWDEVYRPWASTTAKTLVCRRPKLTQLELVRKVVDDNRPVGDLAQDYRLSKQTILDGLTAGLDLYNAQKREK